MSCHMMRQDSWCKMKIFWRLTLSIVPLLHVLVSIILSITDFYYYMKVLFPRDKILWLEPPCLTQYFHQGFLSKLKICFSQNFIIPIQIWHTSPNWLKSYYPVLGFYTSPWHNGNTYYKLQLFQEPYLHAWTTIVSTVNEIEVALLIFLWIQSLVWL